MERKGDRMEINGRQIDGRFVMELVMVNVFEMGLMMVNVMEMRLMTEMIGMVIK